MATKQELLQKVSEVLDTIELTSGWCGIQELQNSSLPEFITWYENNIQYCSQDAKEAGEQVVALLKTFV